MNVNPGIFKAYDIRGIYPTDLDESAAYAIGRAFVTFLKAGEVLVGRDMRLSGPQIFDAVTRGIMDQGADVVDIGMVSTDQYYFACSELKLPGMADAFYKQQVGQHLKIGIRTMERLRELGLDKLHSRKLRSFAEVAFQ